MVTLGPGEFDGHALQIGHICIGWASLEAELDFLIEVLAPLEAGAVSEGFQANTDIKDKIQILLALGFVRKRSKEWFKELQTILVKIDQQLRPERNRNIHDRWVWREGNILRRTLKTALKKPQSFKLTLSTSEDAPVTPEDLKSILKQIYDATVGIRKLMLIHLHKSIHDEWLADQRAKSRRNAKG